MCVLLEFWKKSQGVFSSSLRSQIHCVWCFSLGGYKKCNIAMDLSETNACCIKEHIEWFPKFITYEISCFKKYYMRTAL